MTLAQQYNELFRSECSEHELRAFVEQHKVSSGTCCAKLLNSFSIVFADCSVWGYGMISGDEMELDEDGYHNKVKYSTEYHH